MASLALSPSCFPKVCCQLEVSLWGSPQFSRVRLRPERAGQFWQDCVLVGAGDVPPRSDAATALLPVRLGQASRCGTEVESSSHVHETEKEAAEEEEEQVLSTPNGLPCEGKCIIVLTPMPRTRALLSAAKVWCTTLSSSVRAISRNV